jgi:hypothetical protein
LFYFPSDTENKRQNHGNAENKGYKQNLWADQREKWRLLLMSG